MRPKPTSVAASAVVLSLLLIGIAPVVAQTSQNSPSSSANALIQLAQAAQGYAGQLLTIAQQHGVNSTTAQSLIKQGDGLLSQAQSEVNTNSTQAARDALGAMKDFRGAAESLQSAVVVSVKIENQIQYLQSDILRIENRTGQLQAKVDDLCSPKNASAATCSDAKANLGKASADTTQASTLLASITSSSTETQINAIVSLLTDATGHLQQVASDINNLASSMRDVKAVQYIQTILNPRLSQLQQSALKANITSSQRLQIQGQLGQAQTLLGTAITSFQSGDFSTGVQQTNQATQLMTVAAHEIAQDTGH